MNRQKSLNEYLVLDLSGKVMNSRLAVEVIEATRGKVFGYRIHDLVDDRGSDSLRDIAVRTESCRLFLDMKFAETPSGMAKRMSKYPQKIIWGATVFSEDSGAIRRAVCTGWRIFAVTALSPSCTEDLEVAHNGRSLMGLALGRARLALCSGAQGLVVPGTIVKALKETLAKEFLRVADGSVDILTQETRWLDSPFYDHRQVVSPAEAIRNGATLVTVGQEVTEVYLGRESTSMIAENLDWYIERLENELSQLPLSEA